MINFRIIARVFSLLLIVEGLFMLLSAGGLLYLSRTGSIFLLLFSSYNNFTGLIVFTPLRNEERI